jgi:alpha-beta hydrolase superfamily lysophospholipase
MAWRMTRQPAADGTPLTLHRWTPEDSAPRALLYYVHGIQSHAGWLFETGPELARRGVACYALDRRGSGRSGGVRGDLPSAATITADYLRGLRTARAEQPGLPVTVLGQSFGASIVAAMAGAGAIAADRLIYCTPALGQQRARHGTDGLKELLELTGLDYAPIGLADEDYTDEPRYLEFMANDNLMLRQLTARARATMAELELSYIDKRARREPTVHFVRTEVDPIIRIDAAEQALGDLHGTFGTVAFPITRHYIEFSHARRAYWDWLADVVVPAMEGAR